MSNMTTSPTRCFVHLLNGARKSCIIVGLAIIILGLVEFAEAATDFCQKTAQDALQGCQDAAESGRSVAQGKCDNVAENKQQRIFRTRSKPVRTDMRRARPPVRNSVLPDTIR